jgi:iron-sulfur cluster repair protein YtfE (RIC family)
MILFSSLICAQMKNTVSPLSLKTSIQIMKNLVDKVNKEISKIQSEYHDHLKNLEKGNLRNTQKQLKEHGWKDVTKEYIQEKWHSKMRNNIQKIENENKELFPYIKKQKLNSQDLATVRKHIVNEIKKELGFAIIPNYLILFSNLQ